MVKVRACIRCKKYIVIHTNNLANQKDETQFNSNHKGHIVTTLEKSELDDTYKNSTPQS